MTGTGDLVSLTGLAGAQGGVVLTAQALAGGWDRRQLNRCLLREGWTRIGRGIWVEPERAVDAVTEHGRAPTGRTPWRAGES
ncbi:type IV toxin-antitoxin system AbiEi family antitoxin domain-containing protein [Streptomyces sp. NBS 14/10]|uniref:type IV toxin-antitoxin system AbiEi family antitoxin domain-containing protein n=1 Tax=Streptomyces sp. NBS 14/10 TaxID=1945643 RepID=UPI000B7E5EFF|nr:type IV toxin-antitoxin system AbiEi family antitoxin domain-containing protein [Streptomyces sp. NBS 14/10]KAK1180526.1 type IV toxin-antitoxin system AbiEi family antitoxin domain-containing protein [Streptomyces sp. NBS 14/10]